MESIGVRELRQHASRYLARVASGETLTVTDRGRPVARLVPVSGDSWEDLIAAGRVIPAEDPGSLLDIEPLVLEVDVSAELARMRQDER